MRQEAKRINDQWDAQRIQMAKTGTLLERAEKRERQVFDKIEFFLNSSFQTCNSKGTSRGE